VAGRGGGAWRRGGVARVDLAWRDRVWRSGFRVADSSRFAASSGFGVALDCAVRMLIGRGVRPGNRARPDRLPRGKRAIGARKGKFKRTSAADTTGVHTQSSRFLAALWWPTVPSRTRCVQSRQISSNPYGKWTKCAFGLSRAIRFLNRVRIGGVGSVRNSTRSLSPNSRNLFGRTIGAQLSTISHSPVHIGPHQVKRYRSPIRLISGSHAAVLPSSEADQDLHRCS
jgi:hypothetical protein